MEAQVQDTHSSPVRSPPLRVPEFQNEEDQIAWQYCTCSSFTCGHTSLTQLHRADVRFVASNIQAIDGPKNPYRDLSFVALSSPVLLETILCIATEHMLNFGFTTISRAAKHKQRMLSSIHQQLKKHNDIMSPGVQPTNLTSENGGDAFLMAIVLQGVVVALTENEALEPHMLYATSLIQPLKLFQEIPNTPLARTAIQRFTMMDLTLSISRQRRSCAPADFILHQPNEKWDDSEPSFHRMTGCPNH